MRIYRGGGEIDVDGWGLGRMFLSAGNLAVNDVPLVLDTVEHFVDERNQILDRHMVLNIGVLGVENGKKTS